MKYRKKPVVIEAIQWTGSNLDEIINFCEGSATYEGMASGSGSIVIETLESNKEVGTRHSASIGDFIIKGVKEEFYPCKPDIFEATYETANTKTKDDIFIQHIQSHLKPNEKVICKICKKSAEEIIKEAQNEI